MPAGSVDCRYLHSRGMDKPGQTMSIEVANVRQPIMPPAVTHQTCGKRSHIRRHDNAYCIIRHAVACFPQQSAWRFDVFDHIDQRNDVKCLGERRLRQYSRNDRQSKGLRGIAQRPRGFYAHRIEREVSRLLDQDPAACTTSRSLPPFLYFLANASMSRVCKARSLRVASYAASSISS